MKHFLIAVAALLVSALFITPASAHDYKMGTIDIHHPYSRATPPGAKVGGGYMTIANQGGEDDRLVSISSPVAQSVQIHDMTMENDVMKMHEVKDGLKLPAGATVELKPGSVHVMFIGLTEPFKEGTSVKATLMFEKAGSVDVDFKVGPAGGGEDKSAAQGSHDQHTAH